MADASIPKLPGRSQPQVRRSVTLPANLLASKSSPGTPPAATPDGAETLFTYHTSKIISFSPPVAKGLLAESKHRKDVQDEEPVGVLPWGSHTERTLSTGSLRLYKVPGSTAFLQSGRTIHAIMSKSRCWCVDGESKFVLRIRGNNYYRIELPNSTTEDQDAVAEFKIVLHRILQYETTPCPFKRSFYIELPEKPDIIFKPWKPKHSPITARQAEDEPTPSEEGSPTPEVASPLHVEKRTNEMLQKSPLPDRSSQDTDGEDGGAIEDLTGRKHSTAYVETVVSNYETMKQLRQQRENRAAEAEHRAPMPLSEDGEVLETDRHTADDGSPSGPSLIPHEQWSRSTSPGVDKGTSSSTRSSNPTVNETALDHAVSTADDSRSISSAEDTQNSQSRLANVGIGYEKERESTEPSHPRPQRSFTAPVPQRPTSSSGSTSSSEQHDEVIPEDLASSSSSTRSASLDKDSVPSSGMAQEEDSGPDASDSEAADVASSEQELKADDPNPADSSSSEPGSSTPEWLDLSAPSTPQVHLQSMVDDEDETRDAIGALDLGDSEASPRTDLRRRFQQRRELSPMPSLTVLHVPSREHPALDVAVVLFRSVCRTLLVLFMQIVVLLMSLASRLLSSKTGAGNIASTERNHSEDNTFEHSDSESTADDFASVISDVASEDDFGVPLEGKKSEKRRASSGVKLRRNIMRSRKSSAQSAT